MGYQEEIEFAIDYLGLFNESLIYICTLRWVQYLRLLAMLVTMTMVSMSMMSMLYDAGLLEEPLSYSLIDYNESHVWKWSSTFLFRIVFIC
jgi:hypothetical protein